LITARLRVSLIHRLSLTIWGLFLVLLLLLALLAYAALWLGADRVVPSVLQKVVQLKAQANEGLLLQAEASARRLHGELLQRLDGADAQAAEQRFAALFARGGDGLWRLRPQLVDTQRAPTLYLHDGAQGLSASARLRAVASYELLREQGPALVPPFFSAYMDFVEDGLMVYARGIDWGANATAQASNAGYPTMQGADPRNNPGRELFWTPAYLDEQARTWMVSVIAPLDWQGRWVGTLGHDVSIASLIDSVAVRDDSQARQFIMNQQGRLIAHSDWSAQAGAAPPPHPAAAPDRALELLQQMVQGTGADSGAGRTPDGRQWVAWWRIRGPGWYQVLVLPQERVNGALRQGLLAVVGVGLLVLLPALWWLRRRVRRLLALPLRRLTQAVDELAQGQEPAPIRLARADELGRLANAFDTMAADLSQQRRWQMTHAQALQTEVDERRQVMQRLQQERARLLALLGAMHQGILFVDTDQHVSYCNAMFRELWAMPGGQAIVGLPMEQVLQACRGQLLAAARLDEQVCQSLAGEPAAAPLELELASGRILMLAIHRVHDTQNASMGHLWVCEDVTQQRQTAAQLITLAERDALTGLYNRHCFEQALERFFRESACHAQPAAVLFFDLDEFKYVNDRFGHGAGDMVLLRVATAVKALVRETDLLSRLGGDEFAIFMPQATLHSAQLLAERVVRAVAQAALHIEGEGHTLRLTSSLGIAHFPTHAASAQELVAHADTAMYQAKHLGKNRWSIYRAESDRAQAMVTRMAWNERIDRALAGGQLRLHFQGVYHAQERRLAHLEALVRMVDEDNPEQLIAPGQFIGHAEKSGKILDIDRWVLRESIRLLAAHPRLPALALNISGRSLDDPDLPGFITEQLAAQGVAPERLLVELTETAAISDLGDAQRFIDALQRAGCTLCLDDFGTGFASFAYLKHLQARVLKIDGLFVRNLPREHDNQVFVRSIIEVAHGMGKLAVAEFVEDEQTLQLLQGMGVDMVQGYHLDKPRADHPGLHGDGRAGIAPA